MRNSKYFAYTLSTCTALTLALLACVPPAQQTDSPEPEPVVLPSQAPENPGLDTSLPPKTLKMNIRLSDELLGRFSILQALEACQADIDRVQTRMRLPGILDVGHRLRLQAEGIQADNESGSTVLTFTSDIKDIGNDKLGIEFIFQDLPTGTADTTTYLYTQAGEELGFINYNAFIYTSGGSLVQIELSETEGASSISDDCPLLKAALNGGTINGIGGDLTVVIPTPTPTPDPDATLPPLVFTPPPSSGPSATPRPTPTPYQGNPPSVNSLSAVSGLPLDTVIISGTDFNDVTEVLFGQTPAYEYTVDSATQITARVPAILNPAQVVVSNPGGSSVSSQTFTPTTGVRNFYVTPTGTGDGSSWANATSNLREAMGASRAGDEVWIAAGTYHPAEAGGARDVSFEIHEGVNVYGGFAGGESSANERDPENNVTILSGDLNENDVYDDEDITDLTDNSFHVVKATGNGLLEGVTIMAGVANAAPKHNSGGGVYNEDASPTYRNITIQYCTALHQGGGMLNINAASPILEDVTFDFNDSGYGGGMYNGKQSTPTLTRVRMTNNAARQGGAIFNEGVSPVIQDSIFSSNSAHHLGGGICNRRGASPQISNSSFSDNIGGAGGGIYNAESSSPNIQNSRFTNNSSDNGGGIYNYTSSSPTISGSFFEGNTARFVGGGMYNYRESSPQISKSVFEANIADRGGGMFNRSSSSPTLTNIIMYNNQANIAGGIYNYNIASPHLRHVTMFENRAVEASEMYTSILSAPTVASSIIWNSFDLPIQQYNNPLFVDHSVVKHLDQIDSAGIANLNIDPFFVDNVSPKGPDGVFMTADDGLRLRPTSPAKDFGKVQDAPPDDILGEARETPPDIGAFEGEFDGVLRPLESEDLTVGTGLEAATGDNVTVHYVGTLLANGFEFDNSYTRGAPFSFTLGNNEVIQGWEQGIVGMKVGGKRKLTIPPHLGYGGNIQGPIPPNSTLVFEIELMDVTKP